MTQKELNEFIKGFKVGDRVTCMDPTSKRFGQQGVVFKKASYIWVKFPDETRTTGFRRQLRVDESAKDYFIRMGFKKGDLVQISDFLFFDRNSYFGLNRKETSERIWKITGITSANVQLCALIPHYLDNTQEKNRGWGRVNYDYKVPFAAIEPHNYSQEDVDLVSDLSDIGL
jgi:hypothetical protein